MSSVLDSLGIQRLIGSTDAPGLVTQAGTLGGQLGDAATQWAKVLGYTPSTTPTPPASAPRSDATLTPAAAGSFVQKLTSSSGALLVGAAALGLLLLLYLRGD